ncbi:MAG: magnesium/cobalt transporter CorA [Candidatus Aminicenantes bacterium]
MNRLKKMSRFPIRKFIHKRSRKAGLPPGTPVYTGEEKPDKVRITVIDYGEDHLEEREISSWGELDGFQDDASTTWINVDGVHKTDIIEFISREFDWHPLVLEDLVNTQQRPKVENHGDYIFIVLKMLTMDEEKKEIKGEQLSLILGNGYVFSFQERKGDIFEPVRTRLRKEKTHIRKMGPDYLAYALMDVVVDHYFLILESMGEFIEDQEERLLYDPSPQDLQNIHRMKREMIFLRRSVWPLRETVSGLERSDSVLILPSTRRYFRDVYDHTIQVIDSVENFRDLLSGMHDTYLSSISHRMNEIMKMLTIIATIFIPLTFIAGVYGMNFAYMPELEWKWGYAAVWGVMIVVIAGMITYFKRKKWI